MDCGLHIVWIVKVNTEKAELLSELCVESGQHQEHQEREREREGERERGRGGGHQSTSNSNIPAIPFINVPIQTNSKLELCTLNDH